MKQWAKIEDSHGDERDFPLETNGTTMDAGRGFKWLCLFLLLSLLAVMVTVYLVFKAIWG